LVLLALLAPMPTAGAAAEPTLAQLRARRTELVRQIAKTTDQVRKAERLAEGSRARQEELGAALQGARDAFARHAVDTYVSSARTATTEERGRAIALGSATADDERRALNDFRRADAIAVAARIDAEQAVADARAAGEELKRLRAELETTIDQSEKTGPSVPAPSGGTPARSSRATPTTQRQAELMARYPFGPVAGAPADLVPTGTVVSGPASWYGPGFDGRPTASGAIFDQEGWTVASRTLPLGTILLITREGKSVLALVNDRGPYVNGRVLDLSRGVARALGTLEAGVASVRAEVLVPAG
jgi:rare lipoprotein A (peptidoglycan hydrolase)